MTAAAEKLGPRRSRTRTALLDAGQRLFAERPVDAVSVDEIVLAAGVAKGSFFNHFGDKHDFAKAIATQIREECEAEVGQINAGEADPLRRLTGGMLAAVHFALARRKQAQVMLRASTLATARDHPLNRGLRSDIEAAAAAGLLREDGREAALLFWLGACNMLMINITERRFSRGDAAARMQAMMLLALTGLGVSEGHAGELAEARAAQLVAMG
ncbi:MAG: TetR/AcrR family transcriptional regulator [Novosphingobium sp.]